MKFVPTPNENQDNPEPMKFSEAVENSPESPEPIELPTEIKITPSIEIDVKAEPVVETKPAEVVLESGNVNDVAQQKKVLDINEKMALAKRYKGVTYHKKNNKWVAQASCNGKSKYLGTHTTAIKAAKVYDAYVLSTIGPEAKTNFPAEEVEFNLLPKLRQYKRDIMTDFGMLGNSMFGMGVTLPGKRDPNRPKHPKNAYLLYVSHRRHELEQSGELDLIRGKGNMHSKFSLEWRNGTPELKSHWQALAEKERERYAEEMDKYTDPAGFAYLNNGPPMLPPQYLLQPPPRMSMLQSQMQMQVKPELGVEAVNGANAPESEENNLANTGLSINKLMIPKSMLADGLPKINTHTNNEISMPPGFLSMLPLPRHIRRPTSMKLPNPQGLHLPNLQFPFVVKDGKNNKIPNAPFPSTIEEEVPELENTTPVSNL